MEASLASLLLRQFISGVIVGDKLTKVEILETISDSETWVILPPPPPPACAYLNFGFSALVSPGQSDHQGQRSRGREHYLWAVPGVMRVFVCVCE